MRTSQTSSRLTGMCRGGENIPDSQRTRKEYRSHRKTKIDTTCLCCGQGFKSEDLSRNRLCEACGGAASDYSPQVVGKIGYRDSARGRRISRIDREKLQKYSFPDGSVDSASSEEDDPDSTLDSAAQYARELAEEERF